MREEYRLELSRRSLLLAIGAGLAGGTAFAGEFWDKKDTASWSEEEIDRRLTKSPWAKEVTAANVTGEEDESGGRQGGGGGGGYPGGPRIGGPRIGIPGVGMPRRGGRGGRGTNSPGGRSRSPYKGTVRWES